MPEDDDFKVVTRRRRAHGPRRGVHGLTGGAREPREEPTIDIDQIIRQVRAAVTELRESDYSDILLRGLDKALSLIEAPAFEEIVCYGLGNFSQTRASKYQLAAILIIEARYDCRAHLYDPLFHAQEIKILKRLDLCPIESNEEAKRAIGDKTCLVYMPHCPYQLTNNFIYANWSSDSLRKCVILSNSFAELVDSLHVKNLEESVNYLAKIQPHATEIRLRNSFEHGEIFNGSSAHVFTREKFAGLTKDFWDDPAEPIYRDESCEFVRKTSPNI